MALALAAPPALAIGAAVGPVKVGGVEVPGVSVEVPGVEVPDVGGTVNQITGQLPSTPQVPDPPGGGADPSPSQPSEPTDPAPTEPSGPSTPAPSDPAGTTPSAPSNGKNRSGDSTGGGSAANDAATAPARARRPDPRVGQQFSDRSTDEPTFSSRLGDAISRLPSGVLIGLIGLAVIALLMTGRSAWFARATRRLKLQRRSLQDDVGVLQSALVPTLPPTISGVGVAVAYEPAAGPAAGGDFHDAFELPGGKVGIVVGDISGHGREAVPRTGIVRYTIRAYLEAGLEPRAAIRLADRALTGTFEDDFATAVAATYDPATRRLVYSCAGHPQPLVIGPQPPHQVEVLSSPPIGIGRLTGSRQTTVALASDTELWFFSDGLTEAHTEGGAMLGRDGLGEILAGHPDPEGLLAKLPGDDHDDLTVCRLRPADTGDPVQPFSIESLLIEHSCDDGEVTRFLEACGLGRDDVEQARERVASERRLEGHVLIRVSQLDAALHWRVERVDSDLGEPAPPVERPAATLIAG